MKILVVGDSFVPVPVFERGLAGLRADHRLEFLQLDESKELVPRSASELSIREYLGTPAQISARIGDADILVVHGAPVTDEVLAAAAALRLICCARGGPVNVDVAAASARHIPVVNTPGKNAESVADQALAFMAFGMRLVVYDPYVQAGELASTEQVATLEELLARSDFVSLHVRATAETENLFGTDQFGAMKLGSYFVNTARESLVDEVALDAALESGHLAGAALDVVRPRAVAGPHPLLRHGNVVITPHIGGATHETLLRGVTMVAQEIRRFAAGEPLHSVVNRAVVKA